MRSASTAAKLISVWLLFILGSAVGIGAQSNTNGISISLSVSSSDFTRRGKPRAALTVRNRSGAPIPLKAFERVGLELQLKGKPFEFCRLDECFSASVFPKDGQLANNDSITFVAKLYDLYWHNKISSIIPANYPRNLFTGVPPGSYELHAVLSVNNSTAGERRSFDVRSNIVSPVTISRAK